MSQSTTLGYQAGHTWLYEVNAAAKLVFFLCVSIACMTTYDTRLLLLVSISSIVLFKSAGIKWRQVSFVVKFIAIFSLLNLVAVYVFEPEYGVKLYESRHVLWSGIGRFTVTTEELFYLFNLILKYICTIPLALLFLLTTNPSQMAASLNKIGVSYKISYTVSLALRYIPDIQADFYQIAQAQQARGFEMSKKARFSQRVKGTARIIMPLVFASLQRIETISTAMELRRFGTKKKRTWYVAQPFRRMDYLVMSCGMLVCLVTVALFYINQGRFYNPF